MADKLLAGVNMIHADCHCVVQKQQKCRLGTMRAHARTLLSYTHTHTKNPARLGLFPVCFADVCARRM
eukprot:6457254-Amphidinium_carterae.1